MSEIKPGTSQAAPTPTPPVAVVDSAFSLEDLDKMIEAEDPGFKDSLQSIATERINDETSIESLDVEVEGATEDVELEKKGPNKVQIIVGKITAPLKKAAVWFHLRRIAYTNRAKLFAKQTIHFFRHDFPEFIKYAVQQLKVCIAFIRGWMNKFIALPRRKKLLLVGSSTAAVLAFFFFVKALSGQWLPVWKNPLIESMADKADKVYTTKKEDMIPFFDAFPEVEFHLLLSKMIVNLTPSPGIPNPMGAFEFYLGLDSNETAIEIKDREKEVLDITQRTIEEFTYEEVMNPTSQSRMRARIRDNINQILNQGRVQKIYVKTQITYRQ